MAIVLGLNACLYVKSVTGSPTTMPPLPTTTDLVKNCKDLTMTLEKNETDITVRGSNGWRTTVPVLKDGTIEFKMNWDTVDVTFGLIRDSFLNNTLLNVLALDGPVTGAIGSQGLQGLMMVSTFTRNEPLEEALSVDVKLRPSHPTLPPVWITTTTLAAAAGEPGKAAA
jgi:hypothetical protein